MLDGFRDGVGARLDAETHLKDCSFQSLRESIYATSTQISGIQDLLVAQVGLCLLGLVLVLCGSFTVQIPACIASRSFPHMNSKNGELFTNKRRRTL